MKFCCSMDLIAATRAEGGLVNLKMSGVNAMGGGSQNLIFLVMPSINLLPQFLWFPNLVFCSLLGERGCSYKCWSPSPYILLQHSLHIVFCYTTSFPLPAGDIHRTPPSPSHQSGHSHLHHTLCKALQEEVQTKLYYFGVWGDYFWHLGPIAVCRDISVVFLLSEILVFMVGLVYILIVINPTSFGISDSVAA